MKNILKETIVQSTWDHKNVLFILLVCSLFVLGEKMSKI